MAAFEKVAHDLQQEGCPRPEHYFTHLGEEEARAAKEPACCICSHGFGDPNDTERQLLQCDTCGIQIHRSCYGPDTPNDALTTTSDAKRPPRRAKNDTQGDPK